MNILKQIILSGFILVFFATCDKVEKPYTEDFGKCGNGNLSIPIRKILLEDYTGHTCGNCPRAAEQTEFLIDNYCDHIVPISVHVGFFAEPYPSGKYTNDFRTEAGNYFDATFGNSSAGLPNGMVNRTEYNGSRVLSYDTWPSAIDLILQQAPTVDINIENGYNVDTESYTSKVKVDFLSSLQNKLNLSVLIVEDSIVNWQKDYDAPVVDIENYVHRHVVRAAVNFNEGETIVESSIAKGQSITKNYTLSLNGEWVKKNCSIVAFVYNADSKEVLQAETQKLMN